MNLDRKGTEELVSFCGGDVGLIDKWIELEKNKEITSIEELENHPLKVDYDDLLSQNEAPLIRKYFIDSDDFEWEKNETLTLDTIISELKNPFFVSIEKDDVLALKEELIRLRFGSMLYWW